MIQEALYQKLQDSIGYLVGGGAGAFSSAFSSGFQVPTTGRVYPVIASENTEVPFVIYTVTGTVPGLSMGGPTGLTTHTATIDTYAIDQDTVLEIAEGIETAVHGWREGNVALCTVSNGGNQQEELGQHYGHELNIIEKR